MENNYKTWTLAQLREREKLLVEAIQESINLVSKPGGWIMFDGDMQQRAEEDLQVVRQFIHIKLGEKP